MFGSTFTLLVPEVTCHALELAGVPVADNEATSPTHNFIFDVSLFGPVIEGADDTVNAVVTVQLFVGSVYVI